MGSRAGVLLYLHVPAKNSLARQGPVIDVLRQTEQELMAPEKMRRRFFGNHAHRLGENFFTLRRIEGLPFLAQQFVHLWI